MMNEMDKMDNSNGSNETVNIIEQAEKPSYLHLLTLSDKLLAAGALVLGVLFVWFFYGKYPGISIPLFVIAFYALLFAYNRPVLSKEAKFGWFLSIPVLMLSLTYLLFGNEIVMILDLLALIALILLQTILITGANTFKWHSPAVVIDLLFGVFYRCMAHVIKPFRIAGVLLRRNQAENTRKSAGVKILTGLLISFPLLLVLLALLSSADMVFGTLIEKLPDIFGDLNFEELFGKVIVALIIFVTSFSYLWSLGHGEKPADSQMKGLEAAPSLLKRRWDTVVIITLTAAVDVLYVVFVAIQFAYLFGKFGLPEGFTYAEYARSGFFELILVTLLNISLLACTLTFTQKGSLAADNCLKVLNTIMIGCTFIMLFSAQYRMSLYEEAYGYTFLRIMTQAFMVFLLVLFIITLARVWAERLPLLKPYIAVAIIAFTVVNYINVDKMIVKKNIERYYSTNVIDIGYFRTLSNDIVGELKKLAGDKNPNVAAEAEELLDQRKKSLYRNKGWQSFNLPDYRARKALGE